MLSKLTKISTAPDRLFEVMCCFSTVVRSEGTGTGRIHPSNSSDSRAMAATAAPEAQASAAVKTWATCTSITWAQTRLEFHICMPSHGISVYKWKNNIQKSRKIMETNQIQCNYTWELNCVKNICCFRNFWFWVQTTIMFVFEHFLVLVELSLWLGRVLLAEFVWRASRKKAKVILWQPGVSEGKGCICGLYIYIYNLYIYIYSIDPMMWESFSHKHSPWWSSGWTCFFSNNGGDRQELLDAFFQKKRPEQKRCKKTVERV